MQDLACDLIPYSFSSCGFSESKVFPISFVLFESVPRTSQGELFPAYLDSILVHQYLFKVKPLYFIYSLLTSAMHLFLTLSSLVSAVLAASRTTPPSGSLTVGSGGTYSTVSVHWQCFKFTV